MPVVVASTAWPAAADASEVAVPIALEPPSCTMPAEVQLAPSGEVYRVDSACVVPLLAPQASM